MSVMHGFVLTILAALAAQAWLNHRFAPRLARMGQSPARPLISVLIPARNEAPHIGSSVAGWLNQAYQQMEVLVYDDASTDDTASRVAALLPHPRLRLMHGDALPAGWRGKPHACHRLRSAARGSILVFADADVTARPAALEKIAAGFDMLALDAFSVIPAHDSPRPILRALAAVQQWAALTFVPAWLPMARRRALFAGLNGQCVAIRADVYDSVGGFAAVRTSLSEDVALGRRLVEHGYRVRLLDGPSVIRCEPYATLTAFWRANVRNLVPIFFGSPALLSGVAAALVALYLTPAALLAHGLARRAPSAVWTWLPLAEVILGVAPRALADRRAGYPVWSTSLHWLSVLTYAALAITAAVRTWAGATVEWRGRRYSISDERS